MTSYSCDPNPVGEISFKLERLLPPAPIPLNEVLGSSLLNRLVAGHPHYTLQQLCLQACIDYGLTISTTSMCRALKRVGLHSRIRHKLAASEWPVC
jgi:hypothetical protein